MGTCAQHLILQLVCAGGERDAGVRTGTKLSPLLCYLCGKQVS